MAVPYRFAAGLMLAVSLSAFSGCEPVVIHADSFEPTLSILNDGSVVRSGEDFRFVVRSNHSSYVLQSVGVDRRLTSQSSYFPEGSSHSSGEVLSLSRVNVSETHRGTLSVVVRDPETGFEKTLEQLYTAVSVASFSLEVVDPFVVDGGDLRIRVHCTHPTFQVKSVNSPFTFDVLQAGKTFSVNDDGYVEFVARKCAVSENETRRVKLVVYDAGSDSVVSLEANVEVRKLTAVSMKLVDMNGNAVGTVYDGDDFFIRVYDNQPSFTVDDFYCEFGSVMNRGTVYDVNYDGYVQVAVQSVVVRKDHSGTVTLALKDPYNDKVFRLSADYVARLAK